MRRGTYSVDASRPRLLAEDCNLPGYSREVTRGSATTIQSLYIA